MLHNGDAAWETEWVTKCNCGWGIQEHMFGLQQNVGHILQTISKWYGSKESHVQGGCTKPNKNVP